MDNKDNKVNLNSYYTGGGSPKKKKKVGFKKWWNQKIKSFRKWWKKRKTWQKALFISAVAFTLALVIAASSAAVYFFSILNDIERDDDFTDLDNSDLGFTDVIDKNVFNIALFGVDSREVGDFTGKSDSLMVLSINKTDNTIRLVSIMRDSLVPYEYKGKTSYTKITEIYALGGPELAVKTLNKVYGLDISEYATVNFYGMGDIVDAVGGIEAELTFDEVDPKNAKNINDLIGEQCEHLGLNPNSYFINTPGKKHLNGVQAVAYARIRYGKNIWGSNNDFGRTERQRYVMQELFKKALSMDITSYPSLAKKLTPHVKTSFSNSEILSLASYLANKPTMQLSRVPSDEYIINADFRGTGASTVYYNYQYAGKVLRAFFYEGITPEDYIEQNGVDLTSWYKYSPSKPSTSGSSSSDSGSDDPSPSQDSSSGDSSDSSSQDSNSSTPDTSTPDPSTSDDSSSEDSSDVQGGNESPSVDSGNTPPSDTEPSQDPAPNNP